MSLVALLLSAALQTSAPHLVFETFKSDCVPERSSMQALSRSLQSKGWVRATPQDHPEVAWNMRQPYFGDTDRRWREATGSTLPQPAQIYWVKSFGSRRLFLSQSFSYVTDWVGGDYDNPPHSVKLTTFMTCSVSDFDSTAPIPTALVSAWAGGQPTESQRETGGYAFNQWDVSGRLAGATNISTLHVPTGSLNGASESTDASIQVQVAEQLLPIRQGYFDG